jgi:superfamily II DNA or RNA helicase
VAGDRPYQREAVGAVTAGLRGGGRGQLVAGCGSGKTRISLRVAEGLVPGGGLVVVLTSSLALVAQVLAGWRRDAVVPWLALAACSDDTVADAAVHLADLPVPVSTSPEQIGDWVAGGGRRLVVGTYHSADRVAAALTGAGRAADLVVYDEAHNVAGRVGPARRRLLADGFLPARRRLFQTATRRTRATDLSGAGRFLSMDAEEVYGPVLYRYPLARGIAESYLDDYQVAAIEVSDCELHALIADRQASYVLGSTRLDLRVAAAQAALVTAVREYGVRRVVSYHNRVAAAEQFAATLPQTLALLGHTRMPLYAGHVSGAMSTAARDRVLAHLVSPPDGGFTLVANSRCLREGVDIPAIDAILFADPREAEVDIIQAVGRALRPSRPGTTSTSTIIVPAVVPADRPDRPGGLDAGAYRTLFRVVRAMRAHDEQLGAALDQARAATPPAGSAADRQAPELPAKIILSVTADTAKRFLTGLRTTIVEHTTSAWWSGYAAARAYQAQHGHLTPPPGASHGDYPIGNWVRNQRAAHRSGWLSADQTRRLDALGMTWRPRDAAWSETFNLLTTWVAANGADVPVGLVIDTVRVGAWVVTQRGEHQAGRLPEHRAGMLARLGVLDSPFDRRWAARLSQLRAFHTTHGHALLPPGHPAYNWLYHQRTAHQAGRLPPERVRAMADLGVVEPVDDDQQAGWESGLAALGRFVDKFGHARVPEHFTTRDELLLDTWLAKQVDAHRSGALPPEHAAALRRIGVDLNHPTTPR